jgi:sulfopyruvate decarboxylase subunit alpha
MMSTLKPSTPVDKAARIVAALKRAGIDLIATLPDAWLTGLVEAINADPAMTMVRVTREEEGVGICAGAFLGGRKAALVAQNAGMLLSANALAGLAMHHQIPLLLLLAQRGGPDDDQYYQVYKGKVTEPVARAIGLPCHIIGGIEDYHLIEEGARQAWLARSPVVLLLRRQALLANSAGT